MRLSGIVCARRTSEYLEKSPYPAATIDNCLGHIWKRWPPEQTTVAKDQHAIALQIRVDATVQRRVRHDGIFSLGTFNFYHNSIHVIIISTRWALNKGRRHSHELLVGILII